MVPALTTGTLKDFCSGSSLCSLQLCFSQVQLAQIPSLEIQNPLLQVFLHSQQCLHASPPPDRTEPELLCFQSCFCSGDE